MSYMIAEAGLWICHRVGGDLRVVEIRILWNTPAYHCEHRRYRRQVGSWVPQVWPVFGGYLCGLPRAPRRPNCSRCPTPGGWSRPTDHLPILPV